MVNEEDHIRLAALAPGFQLEEAWNRVNALDDALGEKLPWAFHPRWGFLTACPTNCGSPTARISNAYPTAAPACGYRPGSICRRWP